jgi:hypothetical protein
LEISNLTFVNNGVNKLHRARFMISPNEYIHYKENKTIKLEYVNMIMQDYGADDIYYPTLLKKKNVEFRVVKSEDSDIKEKLKILPRVTVKKNEVKSVVNSI